MADFPNHLNGLGGGVETGLKARLSDATPAAIIEINAWPEKIPRAASAVAKAMAVGAPEEGRTVEGRAGIVAKLGPGRWLALVADAEALGGLERALPDNAGTLADISGGRAVFALEGPAARRILAKGLVIDLRDAAFPEGAAAMTHFQHVDVTVLQTGPERYLLVALSGFARHLGEALAEAGHGEGLVVETAPAGAG